MKELITQSNIFFFFSNVFIIKLTFMRYNIMQKKNFKIYIIIFK